MKMSCQNVRKKNSHYFFILHSMYGGKKHHLVSSTTKENVFKLKKIYISISFFLYLENRSPENFSLCLRASIIIIGAQIVLFEQFKILCLLAFGISQVSIQSKSSVLLNRYCGTVCTFCHYYTFQIIPVYFFFCKSVQLPAARHVVWQWPTTVHTAGLLSLTAEVQVCLLLC